MINVCVPVLRRYDLLRDLLVSLRNSEVKPDTIYIINNGQDRDRLDVALREAASPVEIVTPVERPLGVAESWNWFIQNVPEERVITNDDVTFSPQSLGLLTASRADLVWAAGYGFSCFVIRDACVEKIGLFDETISPGYGYYEDEDYLQRLDGRGTRAPSAVAEAVDAKIQHVHSGTLRAGSEQDIAEHHRRFKLAQANYAKKWHLEEQFR